MNLNGVTYFFKRKYRKIERVIDFLPIIWNGFDFDYHYSLELFKKQLERQAKFLESNESRTIEAKGNASKIRTALRLMDKVYNGDYETEWVDKFEEQFGKESLDWVFEDTGDGLTSYLTQKYERWNNAEEISKVKTALVKQSIEKQKRAEKLLWEFIGHNLKYWWD
jgi:hypothetical protein